MIDNFQVPDEYLGAFRRLVRRMPVEQQADEAFLQTLVIYLKLGGERLARHRVEVEKAEFVTAFTIVKRQPIEEAGDTEPDGESDENAESDDGDETEEMDAHADEDDAIDTDTIAS